MIYELDVQPEAEADLSEASDWYEEQKRGWGEGFLQQVKTVFERLRHTPKVHAEVRKGVRRALVKDFPYAVYYSVKRKKVTVLAVICTRRDPEIWRSRVK